MNSNTLTNFSANATEFDALSFEIQQERSHKKSSSIPITVSVELEFNCYLHTIHYGEADLGTYSKNSDTGCWEAYPIYNNPLGFKTYHSKYGKFGNPVSKDLGGKTTRHF